MAMFSMLAAVVSAPVCGSIPGPRCVSTTAVRREPSATARNSRVGVSLHRGKRVHRTLPCSSWRTSMRKRSTTFLNATDGDIEPPARDYTGELRMPPEVLETPVVLPAMLFPMEEVLLPGSTQVLHLYEARFLALLDEVIEKTGGLFAHITFHPPDMNGVGDEGLRLNQVASLVRIEEIVREDVGAKIVIVGESRLNLNDVLDSDPYVRAKFTGIPTMGSDGTLAYTPSEDEMAEVEALTEFIDTAVNDVVNLVDRLLTDGGSDGGSDGMSDGVSDTGDSSNDSSNDSKITPEDLWDISNVTDEIEWGHGEVGNLKRAMAWVDGPSITLEDLADKKLPVGMEAMDWLKPVLTESVSHSELQLAERLSFACLQVAPTSTEGDLRKLVSCRTVAMSTAHGLMDRLKLGQIVLDEQRQALRAKVALKSAFGRMAGGGGESEEMDGGVGGGRW